MENLNDAKRVQGEKSTKLHRAEKRPQFRARAAYHEAGHAVAAVALSIQVESVSLHPDKRRGTRKWYSEARTTFKQGENMYGDEAVMILLAGAAAQRRHARFSRFTAMGDYEKAESLVFHGVKAEAAVHALSQKRWDWLAAETSKLIEANWSVIDAVARHLLAEGEISGPEVKKIFREFRGVRKRLPLGPRY